MGDKNTKPGNIEALNGLPTPSEDEYLPLRKNRLKFRSYKQKTGGLTRDMA